MNNCVVCHALIPQSDNVLLGTIDGTIITFDQVRLTGSSQLLFCLLFRWRTRLTTRSGPASSPTSCFAIRDC